MGSKDWVPTNNVHRVGAVIIGVICVISAVIGMASTFWFKADLTTHLHSEVTAVIVGFFVVPLVLAGAVIVIVLGARVLKGALRRSAKEP